MTRAGPVVDVVVIGGGIVGVACAAHLAERGRRVVLLERADIAAGASGRNSGVVQHPLDPMLIELHMETLDLYRSLIDRADGGFALPDAPVGLLSVTHDVAGARRLVDALAASHPFLRPAFLTPDEVVRLEPSIAPGVAACRLEIGYPVEPAGATRAYASWARRLGVDVRLGVAATPWVVDARVHGVDLADGTHVAAGHVVVAAGSLSPALIDPTRVWRPIRPSWGVVVAVDLPSPPVHVLEEAEISIEPSADDPDPDAGVAFSLVTAAGASSLGSTFVDEEPDPVALVPTIVDRGMRFVPAIGDARLGAHRVCARPLSLDGRPLVGAVPGIDGLWLAAGHGPWGISTGPASGRLIADLIDGGLAAPPASLDPGRFGTTPA